MIAEGTVFLRRLSTTGQLLSAATVTRPRFSSMQQSLVTPLASGWLVSWSEGVRYGVRVNAEGTAIDAPFSLQSIRTLAPRPDGTAVALAGLQVDVPPYGRSTAVAVQELTSQSQPKRRASGVS